MTKAGNGWRQTAGRKGGLKRRRMARERRVELARQAAVARHQRLTPEERSTMMRAVVRARWAKARPSRSPSKKA